MNNDIVPSLLEKIQKQFDEEIKANEKIKSIIEAMLFACGRPVEIREFIKNTNFEVINNIGISDEKPVDLTIKDMYKLFGINLQKENFQEDNIEDIIKRVNIICGYNNIQKSPYTVENIEYILKAKALQK